MNRIILILIMLFPVVALAGTGPDWTPGIEGQWGFGPVSWDRSGRWLAATSWDRSGLILIEPDSGRTTLVSKERGAGFKPRWLDGQLYYKEVLQLPGAYWHLIRRFDPKSGLKEILDEGPLLGDVSVSLKGRFVAWTSKEHLKVWVLSQGGQLIPRGQYTLHGYCNLAELDPLGSRAAFNHSDGRIGILDLERGKVRWLTEAAAYAHPAWSHDGAYLLLRGPGAQFSVLEADTGERRHTIPGTHPAWEPDGRAILFDRIEVEAYKVKQSELWRLDVESGKATPLTRSEQLERHPALSPGQDLLAYIESRTGHLHLMPYDRRPFDGTAARIIVHSRLPRTPPPRRRSLTEAVSVDVPYMHQLWDTPDTFNGNWSCGPTSCVQLIQGYRMLPDHDLACSWPYSHDSLWGWYIPNEYTYNGHTYDTLGLAAGDAWVKGAHGYICLERGAANGQPMIDFFNQHHLESGWWMSSSYENLVTELDQGWGAALSGGIRNAGHVIVARGYFPDHAILVNDPYGDANSASWGQYDGEGAVYDWPGYNNGHHEITVGYLFPARGPAWYAVKKDHYYPPTMYAGEKATVYVDFRNQGSKTWQPGQVVLATAEPRGRTSEFHDQGTWPAADRPASVNQATATGAIGRFSFILHAPLVRSATVFEERFQLLDGEGGAFGPAPSQVSFRITVMPDTNQRPMAMAGSDVVIELGETVTLDGSASHDPDGEIRAYAWETPNGTFQGKLALWIPTIAGDFVVTLKVTDDHGAFGTDSLAVQVKALVTDPDGGLDGGMDGGLNPDPDGGTGPDLSKGGCSCSQPGTSAPWTILLILFIFMAFRRRTN